MRNDVLEVVIKSSLRRSNALRASRMWRYANGLKGLVLLSEIHPISARWNPGRRSYGPPRPHWLPGGGTTGGRPARLVPVAGRVSMKAFFRSNRIVYSLHQSESVDHDYSHS